MTEASAIEAASKRLALALDALAAAVERRHDADRGEQMEAANREVAERLDVAIDTIRSVLAANEH